MGVVHEDAVIHIDFLVENGQKQRLQPIKYRSQRIDGHHLRVYLAQCVGPRCIEIDGIARNGDIARHGVLIPCPCFSRRVIHDRNIQRRLYSPVIRDLVQYVNILNGIASRFERKNPASQNY